MDLKRWLLALSTLLIFVLLLSSDFQPQRYNSFNEYVDDSQRGRTICSVVSIREKDGGWTMRLADGQGTTVDAYLSKARCETPPKEGYTISTTGTMDRQSRFFFMESYEVIHIAPGP